MKKELKLSDLDLQYRRETWRDYRKVALDESISVSERLEKCRNLMSCYVALTGDDSVWPEPIKKQHDEMLAWLDENYDRIKKQQIAKDRDEKRGQINMLDF